LWLRLIQITIDIIMHFQSQVFVISRGEPNHRCVGWIFDSCLIEYKVVVLHEGTSNENDCFISCSLRNTTLKNGNVACVNAISEQTPFNEHLFIIKFEVSLIICGVIYAKFQLQTLPFDNSTIYWKFTLISSWVTNWVWIFINISINIIYYLYKLVIEVVR
jgi:hypothetical protein